MKASIDIGTNTVRLLITTDNFEVIEKISKIGRLGEGSGCRLQNDAISRVVKILQYYCNDICYKKHGILPSEIRVAATSAVREADNKNKFLDIVYEKTGINVNVITGITEGILTAAGVMRTIKPTGPLMIIDIGGGSTELVTISGSSLKPIPLSIQIGALRIREKFLSDPPENAELSKAREWINSNISNKIYADASFTLITAAGTPATLAAIMLGLQRYDPVKINGYKMNLESVSDILRTLSSLKSVDILKQYPVVQKGREDLIVAGGLILVEIMKQCKDELIVSDEGLLEGIILEKVLSVKSEE